MQELYKIKIRYKNKLKQWFYKDKIEYNKINNKKRNN